MLSLLVIAVYAGSGGGVEEGEEGEAAGAVHRPHLGNKVWEYVIRGNKGNLQCLDKSTDTTLGQLTVYLLTETKTKSQEDTISTEATGMTH